MYIAIEGTVGSGKTTLSKRLVEYLKKLYPNKNVIWTREPGGSEISDVIRNVVQGTKFVEDMTVICESYLYAASRSQTLRTVVFPVIEAGGYVVSDRCFVSSIVNQGYGRGLNIDTVREINFPAVGNILPDLIIYLDTKVEVSYRRVKDHAGDKFEAFGREYHERVRYGYHEVMKWELFRDKWVTVDANRSLDQVFTRIIAATQLG